MNVGAGGRPAIIETPTAYNTPKRTVSQNCVTKLERRAIAKALHLEAERHHARRSGFFGFVRCENIVCGKKSSEVKYKVRSTNVVRP